MAPPAIVFHDFILVNGRLYAAALSKDEAMEELTKCAGTQFDPTFVKIFKKIIEEDY